MKKNQSMRDHATACDICFQEIIKWQFYVIVPKKNLVLRHLDCHKQQIAERRNSPNFKIRAASNAYWKSPAGEKQKEINRKKAKQRKS